MLILYGDGGYWTNYYIFDIDKGLSAKIYGTLEEILMRILKDLGFNVELRKKMIGKGDREIEVDIWSCKNWNKKVDCEIVNQEINKVQNLYPVPHLKIFIAKSLMPDAKRQLKRNGFFIIELGEKAKEKK